MDILDLPGWRLVEARLDDDGYHHAHRPGSRRCESNTMHPYWRSLDPDVLARLLIEFGGKPCTGAEPPF